MRIAYTTIYDATSTRRGFSSYNSVGYRIGRALTQVGADVDYFGPLRETFGPYYWLKQAFHRKISHGTYNRNRDRIPLRDYARQIRAKLNCGKYDVVLSPVSVGSQPIAYLECEQPIVIWTDSTLASAVRDYPALSWDASVKSNLRAGLDNERSALTRARLVIYPSEWARREAIEHYQLDPAKVKVVQFAANLDCDRTTEQVRKLIDSRPRDCCRILFVGMDWQRKGGPEMLAAVRELKARGVPVQLDIVGCNPFHENEPKPDFVHVHGLLHRRIPDEAKLFDELFSLAHFFFMPSRGEAFGHVFAEASSFGVPNIATNVDGIPSAVRDGVNGYTFARDTAPAAYADAIQRLFQDRDAYMMLACSSFAEFQSRLNWQSAARAALGLIREIAP